MTEKDKEFLEKLLSNKSQKDKYNIGDLAFKGLSTITTFLMIWTFNTVNNLRKNVDENNVMNRYTQESIKMITEFTKEPRFTKEDFNNSMNPIIKQLNTNTAELNSRNAFMDNTQERLIRLEIDIISIKKEVEALNLNNKK